MQRRLSSCGSTMRTQATRDYERCPKWIAIRIDPFVPIRSPSEVVRRHIGLAESRLDWINPSAYALSIWGSQSEVYGLMELALRHAIAFANVVERINWQRRKSSERGSGCSSRAVVLRTGERCCGLLEIIDTFFLFNGIPVFHNGELGDRRS